MTDSAAVLSPPTHPVEPRRPVYVLVAVCCVTALVGWLVQHRAHGGALVPPANRVPLYLSTLALEGGLVLYVVRAGLRGRPLQELIGGRWRSALDVLRDVVLAALAWVAWGFLERGLAWLGGHAATPAVGSILPTRPIEIALWIVLSLAAGFTEELVFRGYLMRELSAMTRSRPAGLVLQAVLFGIAHGYQGVAAMLRITLIGLGFGLLAFRLRSLRAAMLAHAWTDIAAGLLRG